jgi:hypothetical protein
MTIALVLKVNDGIVLAADSATTMMVGPGDIANVYNNANKVFNLHKGLPIGAMTWGLGNVGPASIATIAKDVRRAFQGDDASNVDAKLDEANYSMDTVAETVHQHFLGRFDAQFGTQPPVATLGFLVAGYPSEGDDAHLYLIDAGKPGIPPAEILQSSGAAWWGQPEAISRIMNGLSNDTATALVNLNVGVDLAAAHQLVMNIRDQVAGQVVNDAMPIQDAIDLAHFLVYATIQFVRFQPGTPTVGGPIEIATITKHEGFKWVSRKHYYDEKLNPGR